MKHAAQAVLFNFKCTKRVEIAAGVMPGVRRAWPKVVGRERSSRSTIS